MQPRTRGNDTRKAEQGAERFMAKWIATKKVRADGLRHAAVVVVRPNVAGMSKERIAQSKRLRTVSLAKVD